MKTTDWTYGVEHELGDWDTRQGFGKFGRDREPNICNSNGVAGDPSLRDYPFGAEINSPPSETPEEQGSRLSLLRLSVLWIRIWVGSWLS